VGLLHISILEASGDVQVKNCPPSKRVVQVVTQCFWAMSCGTVQLFFVFLQESHYSISIS
jgi:hypothetical protein